MGPNGSGKSTLANTLLANPAYEVTAGRILLDGEDVTALPTDERARRGLFLGFQHPEEIPGVSVLNFLRQAIARRKGIDDFSVLEVRLALIEWTKRLGMDNRFQERYLNEGFSGGEKKRNEILQMALMEPDVAVLDETDSGLDIDALRRSRPASPRSAGPARSSASSRSRTTSASSTTSPPTSCTCCSTAASSPPAAPSLARGRGRGFDAFRSARRGADEMTALDVATIKRDFPILERKVNGKRLVYLDSASSSQKPLAVLDAMDDAYRNYYANIHRGVYTIAEEATAAFEARAGRSPASSTRRGPRRSSSPATPPRRSTSSPTRGRGRTCSAGDAIVLTHMEHHANVVPWQILAAERGVELRWIPLTPTTASISRISTRCSTARKLLAVSAMSNVLGTINDIRPLADAAHAHGALVLVDACQYVPHVATDVQAWDADFVAFSAHKMLGPTGIGALWARSSCSRRCRRSSAAAR